MSRYKTSGMPPRNRTLVTAAEWFAGGQRVWCDPESAREPAPGARRHG